MEKKIEISKKVLNNQNILKYCGGVSTYSSQTW